MKQKILEDDYTILKIKVLELPTHIKTRVSKLLMYYLAYNYSIRHNLTAHNDFVIDFNDIEIEQTQMEFFENFGFLKYEVEKFDVELLINTDEEKPTTFKLKTKKTRKK